LASFHYVGAKYDIDDPIPTFYEESDGAFRFFEKLIFAFKMLILVNFTISFYNRLSKVKIWLVFTIIMMIST